jgi:hypothetical protein
MDVSRMFSGIRHVHNCCLEHQEIVIKEYRFSVLCSMKLGARGSVVVKATSRPHGINDYYKFI